MWDILLSGKTGGRSIQEALPALLACPPPHQGLAQSLGIWPQGLMELPTEMSVCDQQLPCRKSSPRVRQQEQKPPWIC